MSLPPDNPVIVVNHTPVRRIMGALGLQYACAASVQLLEQAPIHVGMAEVGQAWHNGFAERVRRTIKEEEVDLSEYHHNHDAYRQFWTIPRDRVRAQADPGLPRVLDAGGA
jgi:hypothetical protein